MKEWTLDILISHMEDVVKGITRKLLDSLDSEGYRTLLLEKADALFSEGRYSELTEWSLEMYELQEAEDSLNDLSQINQLSEAQRIKLGFYKDLKSLCYPLFRRRPIDLSQEPFCMSNTEFSILNTELCDFLYDCKYPYLSHLICQSLAKSYDTDDLMDTVIINDIIGDQFMIHDIFNTKKGDDPKEHVTALADKIFNLENHLQVGKRLGLTDLEQAVYDMADTFICKSYDFRQIDYAKELSAWILTNWHVDTKEERDASINALYTEMEACAKRHNVYLIDKRYTFNYYIYDLLHVPLFDNEDEEDEDDDY